ncbi:addiction module toxin RelE [Pseudoramibacter faecis]|uniref:addiction module toxin RelE n=1 Tax=Pseudoramibacter faecis TaxID=3108534 RepID=UPI002E7894E9|nr:addiction module toxin RelE [Pseudoramibacter sp. HA2172]
MNSRTFIQTFEFIKQWKRLGFDDEDLRRLELEIMRHPEAASIMEGTGGLRKMRFAFDGLGKSDSSRVCYVDFLLYKTVYLVTAYPKNKKENLTKHERNEIKKVIALLEEQIREKVGGEGDE